MEVGGQLVVVVVVVTFVLVDVGVRKLHCFCDHVGGDVGVGQLDGLDELCSGSSQLRAFANGWSVAEPIRKVVFISGWSPWCGDPLWLAWAQHGWNPRSARTATLVRLARSNMVVPENIATADPRHVRTARKVSGR